MIERFLEFLACPVDGHAPLELHAVECEGTGDERQARMESQTHWQRRISP